MVREKSDSSLDSMYKSDIVLTKNKTEVTSVKLVLFKWEKLFDILT